VKSQGDDVIILTRYVMVHDNGVQEFACKSCKSMIPMPAPGKRVGVRKRDNSN
jgi:hypothetical protein